MLIKTASTKEKNPRPRAGHKETDSVGVTVSADAEQLARVCAELGAAGFLVGKPEMSRIPIQPSEKLANHSISELKDLVRQSAKRAGVDLDGVGYHPASTPAGSLSRFGDSVRQRIRLATASAAAEVVDCSPGELKIGSPHGYCHVHAAGFFRSRDTRPPAP